MDLFAPSTAPILVLLGFRIGGLLLMAPMFSSRNVPMMVKAGLIVLLSMILFPIAAGSAADVVLITPATALTETLIGFAIGFGGAVLIGAAEAMGDLLAIQIGISGAAALNPLTSTQVPILGTFGSLLALTLMLSVDGHIIMIEAVGRSLLLLPVGDPINWTAGLSTMIDWGATLFALGLRFAAPVIATVLLANVALAVLGRAAPQLNILSVAFPIQIGLGMIVFYAAIPMIAMFYGGWSTAIDELLGTFLEALAPAAGGGA